MARGFSLADRLFNAEKLSYLLGRMRLGAPGFDAAGVERAVLARLGDLALKQRIDWIADRLDHALPGDFETLAGVILAALPAPCDPGLGDDDFGDFIFAPLGQLVVRRGMQHPDLALDLLEQLTQRFSMEYALRPFLNAWEDAVFARLAQWAAHPHYHVRRLVSEGTRPNLPWGIAIKSPPERALPLLDALHDDRTRFVTRSVANHLNDLSKTIPATVLDRLDNWAQAGHQNADELAWMRAHALRTLIKQGDARAMAMLGYRADAPVELAGLTLRTAQVRPGQQLDFEVTLAATAPCAVLVDYVLCFHRGPGQTPRRKVLRLGQGAAAPGRPLRLHKRYRVPKAATTVKIVPGPHRIEIQVNGKLRGGADFEVLA